MLALVFPGQGSQRVGMGKAVFEKYPAAREVFEAADAALGFSLSKLCFEGPEDQLQLTARAQPAILTVSIATWRAIEKECPVKPAVLAGHSLGEYAALVCAGALRFEDAVRIVEARGRFMQEAVPVGVGSMAAMLGLDAEQVEAICREVAGNDVLAVANHNAPDQVVVAGHAAAVSRAVEQAKARGGVPKLLKVSAPFHCPLMKPAAEKLAAELAKISFSQPTVPIVSNVEARAYPSVTAIPDLLVRQVTAAVQWTASVTAMVEMGVQEFVEVGCGKVLSGLVRRIDKTVRVTNVEQPADIDELAWITENDGTRRRRDGTHIIWPDGLEWNFFDPGAHGF